MVSTMMGRRMRAGMAILAALVAISLTGCNQANTPTQYNTLTNQNFKELCTNHLYDLTDDTTLTQTGNTIANVDAPNNAVCQCQYDVFVNNVPINKNDTSFPNYSGPNFTDLNASLKSDPVAAWATVPASVTDALTVCSNTNGASSATTTTAAPTTTQATTPPN
jgi:hypothetical protein